jgi:transposase
LGLPVRFVTRPEQENDMKQACQIITGFKPNYLLADHAYNTDRLIDAISDSSTQPVILPCRHRRYQHPNDRDFYKNRNQIERIFTKLYESRRIATRYDKFLQNFMCFVKIATTQLWLK